MNQDNFMREYFKQGEKVTVAANELQALIRKMKDGERTIKRLKSRVSILEFKASLKCQEIPKEVKLDVKC